MFRKNSWIIVLSIVNLTFSCESKEQVKNLVASSSDREIGETLIDTVSYQIKIPFDNQIGVPFFDDEGIYGRIIPGFDIDKSGRLYFMGGDTATLAVVENGKQITRRKYTEFKPNPMHFFHDKLVVFDNHFNLNNLFHLSTLDGHVLSSFEGITENKVNNFHFQDSLLTLVVFDIVTPLGLDSDMAYVQYDLNGMLNQVGSSLYPHLGSIWPEEESMISYEYLGDWKEYFVFWHIPDDSSGNPDYENYEVMILNSKGETVDRKLVESNFYGDPLYGAEGNPQEHRKLRNEKIYVLARKGDDAVITVLPLAGLFPDLE
jgi:hypothetical protein